MNWSSWKWSRKPLITGLTLSLLMGMGVALWHQSAQSESPWRYPFAHLAKRPGIGTLRTEIAFYQKRIQINPTDGLDRAALANLYLQMAKATGNSDWYLQAEQAAHQSLANLPFNNFDAQLTLAQVAEARHDFPVTIRLAEAVLKETPKNGRALSLIVTSSLAQGKLERARQGADQLVNQSPTLGNYTLRALVNVAQGQDQQAVQDFQQALAMEQPEEPANSAWVRTLLGRYYADRGQGQTARQLLQEALRIQSNYPLAMVKLAELEARQGNYAAAERLYSQILGSAETAHVLDHVAWQGLAHLKVLQNQPYQADQLWAQAEQQFRSHQNLKTFGHRRELAKLLLGRGRQADVPEALALMQAEVKLRQDAETLNTLAWALSQSQRHGEAQKVLQTAMALGTQDAGLFYRAGLVELALGNKVRATDYAQQALTIDPSFDTQAQALLVLGG